MSQGLIESGIKLRRLLGKHYDIIKALDPLPRERRRTSTIRNRYIKKYGSKCALCHREGPVEAAHIIPLELGAKTEANNIILLDRACHRNYDNGFLSINAMKKLATQRRSLPLTISKKAAKVPDPTITAPPKAIKGIFDQLLEAQRERKFVKATKIIDKAIDQLKAYSAGHSYLLIKRGELTRRRAAQGVLDSALKQLISIKPDSIPEKYLPVYYYELAYVYRLTGSHRIAANTIRKSAVASINLSGSKSPGVDYVAAESNALMCGLSELDRPTPAQAEKFERAYTRLEKIAARHGAYWGGRWALNCVAHTLYVRMKARNSRGSWEALRRTRELFYDSDITCGWDSAFIPTLSLMEGFIHVLFAKEPEDVRHGVGLLARSFISRVGPRLRPEGIRDVGFTLAIGLRLLNRDKYEDTAAKIEELMHCTVDGTSVIWPWRAEE